MTPEAREAKFQNDTAKFLAARREYEQATVTFDIAFNKAANDEITQDEYEAALEVHNEAARVFMAAQAEYRGR